MKKTIGKKVGRIIFGLILALCAVFSFGIIVVDKEVKVEAGGGISIESGADININGGYIQNNYNSAITIELCTEKPITISNTRISGSENGAIVVTGSGTLTIDNCVIENNTNKNNGGAIYVGENVTLNISNTKILNNSTEGNGGAIYAAGNSRVNISGATTISGNRGVLGGGVYLETDALLNDGAIAVNEYFADNTSTSNTNVWQNVYYQTVDVKLEFEGIVSSEKFEEVRENLPAASVYQSDKLNLDLNTIYDYYTMLPYEDAPSDKILQIEDMNGCVIDQLMTLEGKSKIYFYGENKITYTANNAQSPTEYSIKASRREISGALKLQGTYNDLPVTIIEGKGFYCCEQLTGELILPETFRVIGDQSFRSCIGFTGDLVIPNSVTTLASQAFSKCEGFNGTLTISENITCIEYGTFQQCSFTGKINIPDKVTYIGNYAFQACTGFTGDLVIPNSVKKLYGNAFSRCSGLNGSVVIGSGVTEIQDGCFEYCTNIQSLNLSWPLQKINQKSFVGCKMLTSVVFPSSLEEVGTSAFEGCTSLSVVDTGAQGETDGCYYTMTSIGDRAFYNTAIESFTVPANVTYLGTNALASCEKLKIVNLNSIKFTDNLPAAYFKDFSSLEKVNLASTITFLPDEFFSGCVNLKTITTAFSGVDNEYNLKNITKISSNTFAGSGVEVAVFNTLADEGTNAFSNCNSLVQIRTKLFTYIKNATAQEFAIKQTLIESYTSGYELVIPTTFVNMDVTALSSNAFANNTFLVSVVLHDGITEIADGAFSGCSKIANVQIDGDLTFIGRHAFYANAFVSFELPDTCETIADGAFKECKNLETFIVGAGAEVTTIGDQAFYNCYSLNGFTIPSKVTTIGESAFEKAFALGSEVVFVDGESLTLGDYAFRQAQMAYINKTTANGTTVNVLPNRLSVVGNKGFFNCEQLTGTLIINSNVHFMVEETLDGLTSSTDNINHGDALGYCYGLTAVWFGQVNDGVFTVCNTRTTIPYRLFYNSTGIAEFILPESLQHIAARSLARTAITEINIPNSVLSIGRKAFADISTLVNVNFDEDSLLNEIGDLAFENTGLVSFNVPSKVMLLGKNVFGGCVSLTKVGFKNPFNWFVTTDISAISGIFLAIENTEEGLIKNKTLLKDVYTSDYWKRADIFVYTYMDTSDTYSITMKDEYKTIFTGEIVIPDFYNGKTITKIGDNAFSGCTGLTGLVKVPDSIVTIGSQAFAGCSGIETIKLSTALWKVGTDYHTFTSEDIITDMLVNNEAINSQVWRANFNGEFNFTESNDSWVVTPGNNVANALSGGAVASVDYTAVAEVPTLTIPRLYVDGVMANSYIVGDFTGIDELVSSNFKLIIPEGVISVTDKAFQDVNKLSGLTIGESVTHLGVFAFENCVNATEINFNCTIPNQGYTENIFKGFGSSASSCVLNIADGITRTPNYLFKESGITDVVFENPTLISEIGWGSFFSNKKLTSVNLGETKTTIIGGRSFEYCEKLTGIEIPSVVNSIGITAFAGCISLSTIEIPSEVTWIGYRAFANCTGLSTINYKATDATLGLENANNETQKNADIFAGSGNGSTVVNLNAKKIPFGLFYSVNYKENKTTNAVYRVKIAKVVIGSEVEELAQSAFYTCDMLTAIDVTSATSLTTIGHYAFADCSALTSVTIPSTVTSIGYEAFAYCSGLTEIKYNANNATLSYTVGGTTYEYPYVFHESGNNAIVTISATNVPAYLFYNNANIGKITIENSVTTIGDHAFDGCKGVTELNYNANITNVPTGNSYLFRYLGVNVASSVVNIGGNVTSLPYALFDGADGITSVNIPETNSLTTLGGAVFYSCDKLASINLENATKLTTIGADAFRSCSKLSSITIPGAVSTIDINAFTGSGLTSASLENDGWKIGNTYNYISNDSYAATKLKAGEYWILDYNDEYNFTYISDSEMWQVTPDTGVADTFITEGEYAKLNVPLLYVNGSVPNSYEVGDFTTVTGYDYLHITDGVTSIRNDAFKDRTNITRLTHENTVTYIGTRAFSGCVNMTGDFTIVNNLSTISERVFYNCQKLSGSVTIKNGVTSIGRYAFENCFKLSGLTMPDTVLTIGDYAFDDCSALTSITIPSGVTAIGEMAFAGCVGLETINYNTSNHVSTYTDGTYHNIFAASGNGSTVVNINGSYVPFGLFYSSIYVSDKTTNANYRVKIARVVLGSAVEEVAQSAFHTCDMLTEVNVANATSLKRIGPYAFTNCTALTSITIPSSVETISYEAFAWCTGLTSITYNANNATLTKTVGDTTYTYPHVFYKAGNNAAVTIGATSVPAYLFYNVTGISSVTFSSATQTIGVCAFDTCSSLSELDLSSVTQINERAFYNCQYVSNLILNNKSSVEIGSNAFYNCGKSVSLIIRFPAITQTIDLVVDMCFENYVQYQFANPYSSPLQNATSIIIQGLKDDLMGVVQKEFNPGDLKSLELDLDVDVSDYAFYNANFLNKLTINSNCTRIGKCSFYGAGLTELKTGNSKNLQTIGERAFYNCYISETIITLYEKLSSIGASAFNKSNFTKVAIKDIKSFMNIDFGDEYSNPLSSSGDLTTLDYSSIDTINITGVEKIKQYTFYNFRNLLNVTMSGVEEIGDYAFYNCSSMKVPTGGTFSLSGVEEIGDYAFYNCSSMKVPTDGTFSLSSVKYFGAGAFEGCTNLNCPLNIQDFATIGYSAFKGCENIWFDNSVPGGVESRLSLYGVTIGDEAFWGCKGLTGTLDVSGSNFDYNTIDKQFCGTGFTKIILPAVDEILLEAFTGCDNLEKIEFEDKTKSYSLSSNTSYTFKTSDDNILDIIKQILETAGGDIYWWLD